MQTIIITGSTRGIGFGLAEQFLKKGHNVVISGRSQSGVDAALEKLSTYNDDSILGQPCDMTELAQVEALWAAGAKKFGRIDVWINNAGRGHSTQRIWELPIEDIHSVLDLDINGLIYGSRVAISNMLKQGSGFVYNMEGFGSDGRTQVGMGVYGASKSAVTYLTKSLILETKGTPVKVGYLNPGVVATDFFGEMFDNNPEEYAKSKKMLNIVGDKLETVAPFLVDNVLRNNTHGKRINWLTPAKMMGRFITSPFVKREVFA